MSEERIDKLINDIYKANDSLEISINLMTKLIRELGRQQGMIIMKDNILDEQYEEGIERIELIVDTVIDLAKYNNQIANWIFDYGSDD